MRPIRILHCADLHLGAEESALGGSAAQRSAEVLLTFERILQTAKENAVDLLLVAGDLFDRTQADAALVRQVWQGFSSLGQIPVFIAAGNHDYLWSGSPYYAKEKPENVHIFPTETACVTLEDLGVRVFGRSFGEVYSTGNDGLDLAAVQDDLINIGVLHGDTSNANSPYNGIASERIAASGLDYLALGHIHAASAVLRSGATHYAYSGCPEGQGFDELGPKGVWLGTVGKKTADLTFVPLCRRMHLQAEVPIESGESGDQTAKRVLAELQTRFGDGFAEHFYKIILTGAVAADETVPTEEIKARLCEQLYFVKIEDATTVSFDLEILCNEPTLQGVFARKMREKMASAAPEDLPRLQKALMIGLKAFYSEVPYRDR